MYPFIHETRKQQNYVLQQIRGYSVRGGFGRTPTTTWLLIASSYGKDKSTNSAIGGGRKAKVGGPARPKAVWDVGRRQ